MTTTALGPNSICVELPSSLWIAFDLSIKRQSATPDAAVNRLIDAMPGLSLEDLLEIREPRKENVRRGVIFEIGPARKANLEHLSRQSGLSTSAIIRKLIHAFFITRQIALFNSKNGAGIKLRLTQMHFEFAEDYERDGPI